jgi:hypothetical protein
MRICLLRRPGLLLCDPTRLCRFVLAMFLPWSKVACSERPRPVSLTPRWWLSCRRRSPGPAACRGRPTSCFAAYVPNTSLRNCTTPASASCAPEPGMQGRDPCRSSASMSNQRPRRRSVVSRASNCIFSAASAVGEGGQSPDRSTSCHGFTNTLACCSGFANAVNASRTPSNPTWPVISGATSIMPFAM